MAEVARLLGVSRPWVLEKVRQLEDEGLMQRDALMANRVKNNALIRDDDLRILVGLMMEIRSRKRKYFSAPTRACKVDGVVLKMHPAKVRDIFNRVQDRHVIPLTEVTKAFGRRVSDRAGPRIKWFNRLWITREALEQSIGIIGRLDRPKRTYKSREMF